MEKKTIGQFIAALRKANGMTQKELAGQLNVSDKTVSRWERDESAPDLSLIPVIAEIFEVTSDEILMGERRNFQEDSTQSSSGKGKKQIALLLNRSKTKFHIYSMISMGIAGVGLIGAMIANFGFLRAHVGFFIGCVFYLAGIVCEGIFLLITLSAISIEEIESKDLAPTKRNVIKWFKNTITVIICIFAFTLPLFVLVYDTYCGLNFDAWLLQGLVASGIAAIICFAITWLIPVIWKDKNILELTEEQKQRNSLKLKFVKRTAIAMFITFILQGVFNSIVDAYMFVPGTTFDNYEDFKSFMEKDMNDVSYERSGLTITEIIHGEVVYDEDGNLISGEEVYDEDGNIISEEEALTEYLYGSNGEVIIQYIARNQTVRMVDFGNEDGLLPITIYTTRDHVMGDLIIDIINVAWALLYVVEIAVGIRGYIRKKGGKIYERN